MDLFRQDATGDAASPSDTSSDGSAGAAPIPPTNNCRPSSTITARVMIQNVLAKACVTRGPATPIGDQSGFSLLLTPCAGGAEQIFLPALGDVGDYEFRHEVSDENLDVLFAANDDGTPLVLFDPYPNYNQRFFLRPLATPGQMQLAPRHIPDKCLSLRNGRLEIWPCDAAAKDQVFELPACGN